MCNRYEPVKTPAKKVAKVNRERQINQSQHGFNDDAGMTNDETLIDRLVQCRSLLH
jgi:hypothetical protein